MKGKIWPVLIVGVLSLGFGLAACNSGGDPNQLEATPSEATPLETTTPSDRRTPTTMEEYFDGTPREGDPDTSTP